MTLDNKLDRSGYSSRIKALLHFKVLKENHFQKYRDNLWHWNLTLAHKYFVKYVAIYEIYVTGIKMIPKGQINLALLLEAKPKLTLTLWGLFGGPLYAHFLATGIWGRYPREWSGTRCEHISVCYFSLIFSDYNLFIGWFQLYYFHFYCQLSWLDVIQDDLKFALATMQNFRYPFQFQRFFKTLLMWLWHVMMVLGKRISKLKDLQSLNF